MPANAPVQRRLKRLESGLAARFAVRRREVRDWGKVGGLAAAMAVFTALARLLIG
jgi:hypothetical protein